LGRYELGYEFPATTQQADAILDHVSAQIDGGLSLGPDPHQPDATRFQLQDYYVTGPNCTTLSADAFSRGFPSANLNTDIEFRGLGFKERAALFMVGEPQRTIMPQDLEMSLERQVNSGAAVRTEY
jgi:hypothetical protein